MSSEESPAAVVREIVTTAALGVITLRHCLGEQRRLCPNGELTGLSRRFQRRLARVTAVPVMFATSEDYRYRGATGRPPGWGTGWMHRYLDQVVRLGTQDPRVRWTFLEAFHLLKPPAALFHPAILWRALRQTLARDGAERARAVERDLVTST